MKHIFVGQNILEPVNYSSFLPDTSAINYFLWKSESQNISVLMNIDSLTQIVNKRRPDITALPGNKLPTKFFPD